MYKLLGLVRRHKIHLTLVLEASCRAGGAVSIQLRGILLRILAVLPAGAVARRREAIDRVVGAELALRVRARDHFVWVHNRVSALQVNIGNSTPVTHFAFLEDTE